jgi:hypothetical protein
MSLKTHWSGQKITTQFKEVVICETYIKLKLKERNIRTKSKFSLFKENEPFPTTVTSIPLVVDTTYFSDGFNLETDTVVSKDI